ncbi:hypothetical protein KW792_01365 [Candidatus Saccharibacteria bacterium]|nr:hypothetical protein [Candidatus Saccharibacteria bacterium]
MSSPENGSSYYESDGTTSLTEIVRGELESIDPLRRITAAMQLQEAAKLIIIEAEQELGFSTQEVSIR